MNKIYTVREQISKEAREKLKEFSDVVAHLLFHRGVETTEDAAPFVSPDYKAGTHDPMLMPDMEKACDRIVKAIKENEKVTIYADYDADGIPGSVVLHDFFKKTGFENFDVYIPHRNREGFGLNTNALDQIIDGGTKLLITIDCGVANVDEVKYANEGGMDVIVTDHHEPGEHVPAALAIVNPKMSDTYPEPMLCGSGVVFKLVQALLMKGDFDIPEGWEKWLLDMVGIATLSDMVPLTGENRIFAHYGLLVLRKTKRPGLLTLYSKNNIRQRFLNEEDVGFTITPRINAASRMGEPKLAFELLSSIDPDESKLLLAELTKLNDERKGMVASMSKEIKKKLGELEEIPPVIVLGNAKWKPSLLGLAASKVVDEYSRPVFLWGKAQAQEIKGSCRGDGTVSIIDLMNGVKEGVLNGAGGHHQAGGFEATAEKIDFLSDELIRVHGEISEKQSDDGLEAVVDWQLCADDVTEELLRDITKVGPFGTGNTKPTFLMQKPQVKEMRVFGKTGEHLEVTFGKSNGGFIKGIEFFNTRESQKEKISASDADFVVVIEKSYFGRTPELRLRIVDVV